MQDIILLEDCSNEIKLWYLANVGKFIVDSDKVNTVLDEDDYEFDEESLDEVEYEREQVDDDELVEYAPEDDEGIGRLSGYRCIPLLKLAVLIKYPLFGEDFYQFFAKDFFEQKLDELQQDPNVAKFLAENENLVYTSLLKDFVQINFEEKAFLERFKDSDELSDFIYDEDYFEERHMFVDENPVLLEFIESNDFSLEFARFFESGCRFFNDNLMFEGSNKDMQTDIENFNKIFLDEDEKEVSNSFYFSGTPYGIPAKDYVAMFSKALKLVGRAKTIVSTATAIATLSNPVTCALGLTSLGIAAVSYLSKNDNLEKNSMRRALLSGAMENIHQVKITLQSALEDITPYFYNQESLIDAGAWATLSTADTFCIALDKVSKSEIELMEAYICCELPDVLDLKRLDACLKKFENHKETRDFILSMYDDKDEHGNPCLLACGLSRLIRLKNLFESIGYFTMSGYLKKFL